MKQDIISLWTKYNTKKDKSAREELIIKYIPLVKYVLGKVSIFLPPHVDKEDLLEAGILGLIDAIEKYDLTREIQFQTYAVSRIRGAMLDELRAYDWLPRSVRRKANLLYKSYNTLEEELHRTPTSEELAEVMGMDVAELDHLLAEISFDSFLSLETPTEPDKDGESVRIGDSIQNPRAENPLSELMAGEEKKLLATAIAQLPDQERLVITLYYYEDLLLKEIGEVLGITESRVSQIHRKAIFSLKAKMKKLFAETEVVV